MSRFRQKATPEVPAVIRLGAGHLDVVAISGGRRSLRGGAFSSAHPGVGNPRGRHVVDVVRGVDATTWKGRRRQYAYDGLELDV